MSEHTAGPWERSGGSVNTPNGDVIALRYSYHRWVDDGARLQDLREGGYSMDGGICPTEADANARLIAAAPELLQVCEDAYECLTTGMVDGVGFDEDQIIDTLQAAIAKATK